MARVLVVDDEQDMRMALRLFLERSGHEVEEAPDGESALSRLTTASFDLVLLDMRMPGMDGVETLGKIRQIHKDLPVIMVTGYGSVDNAAEVMEKGASHYISKPFRNQELLEAMTKVGLVSEDHGSVDEGPFPAWMRTAIWPLVGLCLFLGWGNHRGWFTNRDFTLPYTNPVDMSWQDGKLWMADWFTQSIYVHAMKAHMPILKTYYLPNTHLAGLAVAGERLYTTDNWSHKINRHKLDEFLTIEVSLPSPGPAPSSLFYDGKYLWSIDSQLGKIYEHRLDDRLTVVAEFKAPGHAPVGFYKDDKYAWVSDSQTRLLYKLRLDDQLTPLAAYSLEDLQQGGEPLACFRWIDSNLWFARDRKPMLFKRAGNLLRPAELPQVLKIIEMRVRKVEPETK